VASGDTGLGIKLLPLAVRSSDEFDNAFAAMIRKRPDAFLMTSSTSGRSCSNHRTILLAPLIEEVIGTAGQLAEKNENRLVVEVQENPGRAHRGPAAPPSSDSRGPRDRGGL
jgi:hypothetical protein